MRVSGFMALTLAEYKAHAKHALGGEPAVIVTSADATKQQIVNDAGRILMGLMPWRWAEAAPATVAFTSGDTFKALPADFAEMVACAAASSSYTAKLTTFDDLLIKRSEGGANDPSAEYWFTIVQALPANQTTVMGPPRLEMYPAAPVAGVTLNLLYRRGWTELTANAQYPYIPADFEPLLIALVRAVARGYEEDSIETLVSNVVASPIFTGLADRDARIRPDTKPAVARGGRS